MKSIAEIVLERISQGAATSSAQGHVTYANERLAAMAGMPRSSLLGMPLAALVRAEPDRKLLAALLNAGQRGSVECRVTMGRNSHTRRVLVSAAPLHGETICLFTDLTELVRRESSDAAVRHFIGALGQELGQMMQPILAALAGLRRSGQLDEGTRQEVARIECQASRVLQRTEEMQRADSGENDANRQG